MKVKIVRPNKAALLRFARQAAKMASHASLEKAMNAAGAVLADVVLKETAEHIKTGHMFETSTVSLSGETSFALQGPRYFPFVKGLRIRKGFRRKDVEAAVGVFVKTILDEAP